MVEGLLIAQNYDRDDDSRRFRDFPARPYFQRFQRNPGYSSVSAYDAATVVLICAPPSARGVRRSRPRPCATGPMRLCSRR